MLLEPMDALCELSEYIASMMAWRDQNGDYDTGMHSVSTEALLRMRRVVDAVVAAVDEGRMVRFPAGFDCTAYLTLDGSEKLEVV